jgi:hypothetical protein
MGERRRRRAEQMRGMYAGGRPNEDAKAIHRRYVTGPLPRLLPIAAVLEVPGRVSGATVHVPLVIVPYRARWYVTTGVLVIAAVAVDQLVRRRQR